MNATPHTCNKCKIVKPYSEFNKEARSKTGYNPICRECVNSYMRAYKAEYRKTEKYKEAHRKYQTSDGYREWQRNHKRKPTERLRDREYRKTHKMSEASRIKMNAYRMARYRSSPKVRIDHSMAISMGSSLQGAKGGRRWESLVGYTIKDLMNHLEKLFDASMTWENYGSYWHIDHKIPKCYYKFDNTDAQSFIDCWSLDNLQPLEAGENLRKNNKLIYVVEGTTI